MPVFKVVCIVTVTRTVKVIAESADDVNHFKIINGSLESEFEDDVEIIDVQEYDECQL
jgi:hypothetical protein